MKNVYLNLAKFFLKKHNKDHKTNFIIQDLFVKKEEIKKEKFYEKRFRMLNNKTLKNDIHIK